jgi:hypothetical protein
MSFLSAKPDVEDVGTPDPSDNNGELSATKACPSAALAVFASFQRTVGSLRPSCTFIVASDDHDTAAVKMRAAWSRST